MNICLNGDLRDIPDTIVLVAQLFVYLDLDSAGRMLILNGEIYTKQVEYRQLKICPEDAIEILQFVGGG